MKIFGISNDFISSHLQFKKKHNLPFDLLADKENLVRKALGVPANLLDLIDGRITYIVDSKGVVCKVFNSQLNFKKRVSESIKAIGVLE